MKEKFKKSCLTCGKLDCLGKHRDVFMVRVHRLGLAMALIQCQSFVPMEGVNYDE